MAGLGRLVSLGSLPNGRPFPGWGHRRGRDRATRARRNHRVGSAGSRADIGELENVAQWVLSTAFLRRLSLEASLQACRAVCSEWPIRHFTSPASIANGLKLERLASHRPGARFAAVGEIINVESLIERDMSGFHGGGRYIRQH